MFKLAYIKGGEVVKEMTIPKFRIDCLEIIMKEGRKVGANFVKINNSQIIDIIYDDKINSKGEKSNEVKRK